MKDANSGDKIIGVVAQKDSAIEEPGVNDIYLQGTVAKILRVLKMPDVNTTVIIQGKKRFQIDSITRELPYMTAKIKDIGDAKPDYGDDEFSAIVDSIKEIALQIIKHSPNIPSEASFAIKNIESSSFLINFVSSNMNLKVGEKQALLETHDLK